MREKDDLLLPAADIWTSGAEILPVLLEELKSASLPGKEKGRVKRDGNYNSKTVFKITVNHKHPSFVRPVRISEVA